MVIRPKKLRVQKSAGTLTSLVFWEKMESLLDFLKQAKTITGAYAYYTDLLTKLREKGVEKRHWKLV